MLEFSDEVIANHIGVISGFAFASEYFSSENGTPLIRIRNLLQHKTETFYRASFDIDYMVNNGDILIGMDGDFNVVRWRGEPGLLNQRVCKVSSKSELLNEGYLFHWLQPKIDEIHRKTPQTTVRHLSTKDIEHISIPFFPLNEQRRIAEILDTIDEAIQKTEALISKLKAMKQGLLHDLLTRGLDKTGKLRDPKAHVIPFSDVVQVNPKTDLYGLNETTNVSFIPMSDVSESGQWVIRQARSFKDVRNGYTCFKENDVLFAKITPCMENGKGSHAIGLVNGIGFGTTEFHVLRASAEIEPRYIYYWTMTEELRRKAEAQMTGSAGQRRVPQEFFDNFKIPLFLRSEQRKIVEILDAHDACTCTEEQYRDKLKLQKKGLMHDLLTGKVRVKV